MANPPIAEIFESMDYGPAPEAANIALDWIKRHGPQMRMYVNGQWIAPTGGIYFDSINPATAKPIAEIAQAGHADVESAVSAARTAFKSWSKTPGHVRARYLYALARQVQKQSRLFAVLESIDNGKPIRETRDIDIPLVARHFYHHAGWAQLMAAEFPGYEPLGVVGQIIPWNFPLLMLSWKIAPALAMGNTVVLKPAEFTSLTALLFAEICESIGLPPGVVNIITGDGKVGELLVNHPDVDKIAFTGSTEVGRTIRKQTAGSGKRLSLELGGKSPFIVFDDADLDSVVEGVVDAIWFNQGQVCCAGSRLLVQENVADKLIRRLRDRIERLRVGDPLDKAVDIGAIIAPVQLEKIKRLVAEGVQEGAQIWQPSWSCPTEGYFFPPTLFTNVAPASMLAQVEIFGPVLVSMSFRTPAEAVAIANNTRYGLAASIWSDNLNLSLDVARKVKAGTVWINSTNLFDAASGFGGYRESGYGREGGKEGLYEYMRHVAMLSPTPNPSPVKRERLEDEGIPLPPVKAGKGQGLGGGALLPPIDRTPKLFIGGKQVRPDSGYSLNVTNSAGQVIGEVGDGNRKDIRNAVEAAHAAESWGFTSGHSRAQIMYYIAENLSARADEFAARLEQVSDPMAARAEVDAAIERLFTYAAWADKFDGQVHATPLRGIVLAIPEPIGVIGIACPDDHPLLGFISLIAPVMAMGNTLVAIPSERFPLSATDFYQVLETSDVPAGVVNIVTGKRNPLIKVLAEHDDVDSIWYFGAEYDGVEGSRLVEAAAIGNMKRTWVNYGKPRNWLSRQQGEGQEFLHEATQVKNIWTPYGE